MSVVGQRAGAAVTMLAIAVAILVVCSFDASRKRKAADRHARGLHALAAQLPSPDVAFTGGARWLRAPTLEEPGAAQADGIAFPDPEPGGGALVAPRAAWAEDAQRDPRRGERR